MEQGLLGGDAAPMPAGLKHVERSIRMGFVRKVYSILSFQLLLTAVIAYPVMQLPRTWVMQNAAVVYLVLGLQMVCMCAIVCCGSVLRTYPSNYAFLMVFTATEGFLVGLICAGYTGPSVAMAAVTTTVIFLMMTAYAWTTKSDYTGFGPYLYAALFTMISLSFVMFIMAMCGAGSGVLNSLNIMYCGCGALLFSFYIVYDTQKMLGQWGGHKVQFSVDDYCFAALNLYLDIINLFLYLLQLFGEKK